MVVVADIDDDGGDESDDEFHRENSSSRLDGRRTDIGTDGGSMATTTGFAKVTTAARVPVDGIRIVSAVPETLPKSIVVAVGTTWEVDGNGGDGERVRDAGTPTTALALSSGDPAAVLTAAKVLEGGQEKWRYL
ncbi:hypothetical protein IW261DRAFT_1565547 [Armillaria novae-zelandiae]|uniref:Uncharacterized protein n=1 Tax=Armillaria novae-zelandiae TaxID=153914 RepID=A0AA39P544_9AGAR|nr:hypothetical protein IW261DRAFT_1565547 [Armillaria novae-zelandiae]